MIQARLVFEKTLNTGGSQIPVGIHSKVMFMGVTKESNFFDITFQNKDGQVIRKRLFEPDGSRTLPNESIADAIERGTNNNLSHLTHLMTLIYGESSLDAVSAPDYKSFVEKMMTLLNPKKGHLVNLKVIQKGEYSDLGWKPELYVENFVEGQESKLKFTKKEQEEVDRVSKGSAKSDDLPF